MPFRMLRFMAMCTGTKIALLAIAGASVLAMGTPARAADLLAAPRIFAEPAVPRAVMVNLFVIPGILDLRAVQANPVMRARLEYSLMTALPVVERTHAAPLPILSETQTWKLSRTVLLTFPLAITGRNLVTAEISGTGQLAVMPTGLASGGVFTFTGAF